MRARLLRGVLGGGVGLMGWTSANAFVATFHPTLGHAAAVAASALLAWLCARPAPARLPWRDPVAALAVAVVALLGGTVLSGPNSHHPPEFGLDSFLLDVLRERMGTPGSLAAAIGAAAVGAATGTIVERARRAAVLGLLALTLASFLVAAAHQNPDVLRQAAAVPQPGQYVMDGFLYLRTHHLMALGHDYYTSFYSAYVQRKNETGRPVNPFNWRPPLPFYLWLLLPGGGLGILYAFWILSAAAMAAAYDMARRFDDDALALCAPIVLSAWFLYGACTMWFPFQEYWAAFFLLGGLWAWSAQRHALGAVLLAAAAMSREHMLVLVPLLGMAGAVARGRERLAAWIPGGVVILYYAAHYAVVWPFVEPGNAGLSFWRDAGPAFVLRCLQFGTVYVSGRDWLWLPLLGLGLLGALRVPPRPLRVLLAGSILGMLVGLLFIGQQYRWYWGIVAIPQICAGIGLVGRWLPTPEQD